MKTNSLTRRIVSQTIFILLTLCGQFATAQVLRIGYYGGTFDPVTMGHRQLAERAIEAANLDIMYVMPSLTNAKKPNAMAYEIRKKMVELGFKNIPQIRVADAELERAFASDRATGALRVLIHRHPGARILSLTGDDVISRNFTEFLKTDPTFKDIGFIIGQRAGSNVQIAEDMKQFDFGQREVIVLSIESDKGISSSLVRAKLNDTGQAARRLLQRILAPEVYEFIQSHQLYRLTCPGLFANAG